MKCRFSMKRLSVLVLACVVCLAVVTRCVQGQAVFIGKCPEPPLPKNIQLNLFSGKWYEVERAFAVFQLGTKCVTAEYLPEIDGTFKVINRAIRKTTNRTVAIEGTATPNPDNPAKLKVQLRGVPLSVPVQAEQWILLTDYERYALVWSCNDLGLIHSENLWILSRTSYLPQEIKQRLYQYLEKLSIRKEALEPTDHTNCPANY